MFSLSISLTHAFMTAISLIKIMQFGFFQATSTSTHLLSIAISPIIFYMLRFDAALIATMLIQAQVFFKIFSITIRFVLDAEINHSVLCSSFLSSNLLI